MDIKLGKNDKRYIEGTDDVYNIMKNVLLRDNKIDQEKEHFWIIGLNAAGYIVHIELIALGAYKSVNIETMNVFRVAVMKNASRVIAVHNHPSGRLAPSVCNKDMTDRLIQVGRILNIELVDHLIISTKTYVSFKAIGLMDELEKSLKYVPAYQIMEQIRKEEKAIAKEKLACEKHKAKSEKDRREKLEIIMVTTLLEKGMDKQAIAKIMGITLKQIEKLLNKKQ